MRPRIWLLTAAALAVGACGPGPSGGGPCTLGGSVDSAVVLSPASCDPYRVVDNLYVEDRGRLVIEPGTTLVFSQNVGLYVQDRGALVAVGTPSDKILFTGAVKVRGYWKGITLDPFANNPENELKYVEVEYAGSEEHWSGTSYGKYRAAIDLEEESRLKMTHSLVRESAGFGVYMVNDAYFGDDNDFDGDFAHNTITANASYPVALYASRTGHVDASNDLTGNDDGFDYVAVAADYEYVPTQTWQRLNVPYLIIGTVSMEDGAVLTIAPGTTLVFDEDAGVDTYGTNAALYAVGSASEPITFTARQHVKGYWSGILYNDTDNPKNVLRYVVIEYGGGPDYLGDESGNVMVSSTGNASSQRLEVKDCTIRNSARYGISVARETHYNADIETANHFSGNDSGDFHVQP